MLTSKNYYTNDALNAGKGQGKSMLIVKEITHWLRFRQDGTHEIYFRVRSKTTPTTILVAVIKAHRNRKTNLNAKTNPNPDLQKTCKKKLKEKRKKIMTHTAGFEPVSS